MEVCASGTKNSHAKALSLTKKTLRIFAPLREMVLSALVTASAQGVGGFGDGALRHRQGRDGDRGVHQAGHFAYRQAFGFAGEAQLLRFRIVVDADPVSAAHLFGGDEVGHGLHEQAFDGAFQVARAVLHVGAFRQQEILAGVGQSEDEGAVGRRIEDSLLYLIQFDVEDLAQLLGSERLEGHDFIEAVHEFRSELAAGGIDAAAREFAGELVVGDSGRDLLLLVADAETEAGRHHGGHFGGSQVAGHEDHAIGEVDLTVVAEGERGLVENAEQEVPQGVGRLFNLVEEHEAQLVVFGVELI